MFKLIFEGSMHRLSSRAIDLQSIEYMLESRETDALGGPRWVQINLFRRLRDGGAESRAINVLIEMLREAAGQSTTPKD